jgi:hypothetical protein
VGFIRRPRVCENFAHHSVLEATVLVFMARDAGFAAHIVAVSLGRRSSFGRLRRRGLSASGLRPHHERTWGCVSRVQQRGVCGHGQTDNKCEKDSS